MFLLLASLASGQPTSQRDGDLSVFQPEVAVDNIQLSSSSLALSGAPSGPREGQWVVEDLDIVSDVCRLDNFQDIEDFVPEELQVSTSNETSFYFDPNIHCEVREGSFTCASQEFTKSALFGATTIEIQNVLSGQLLSANALALTFTAVVNPCTGIACWGLSNFFDFPCSVVLTASARR